MSGNNRYTIAHGLIYDTVVRLDVFCVNASNSFIPLARIGYNYNNQAMASLNGYAYIDPDNIVIINGSETEYTKAIVIVEYTKG